jgi:hypothetical protein
MELSYVQAATLSPTGKTAVRARREARKTAKAKLKARKTFFKKSQQDRTAAIKARSRLRKPTQWQPFNGEDCSSTAEENASAKVDYRRRLESLALERKTRHAFRASNEKTAIEEHPFQKRTRGRRRARPSGPVANTRSALFALLFVFVVNITSVLAMPAGDSSAAAAAIAAVAVGAAAAAGAMAASLPWRSKPMDDWTTDDVVTWLCSLSPDSLSADEVDQVERTFREEEIAGDELARFLPKTVCRMLKKAELTDPKATAGKICDALNALQAVSPSTESAAPAMGPEICPSHPDDLFSRNRIDPTLFGDSSQKMQRLIQHVYEKLMYEPKASYLEGNPHFVTSKLSFLEVDRHVENVAAGFPQISKSLEAAATAWVSFFVLGCLPVITVRNSGGNIQGKEDMKDAVVKFNDRVKQIVLSHPDGCQTMAKALTLSVVDDCTATVAAKNDDGFMDPKVLIVLNNATTMKKMLRSYSPTGAKKIYPCRLVAENDDGSWVVQYVHSDDSETRTVSQLRARGRAGKLREQAHIGLMCCAEMSSEMRMVPGLLWQMKEIYGEKQGKRRVVFIVDEADLAASNPKRNSNVLARLSFQEKEELHQATQDAQEAQNAAKIRRGAREYVFGSVSITATPQALFMCAFPAANTVCSICGDVVDRDDVDPSKRQGGRILGCEHDDYHFSCLNAKVRAGGFCCNVGLCDEGSSSERAAAINDGRAAVDGAAASSAAAHQLAALHRPVVTEDDIEAYTPRLTNRQLTPHVVSLDVPDNYVSHKCDAEGWPTNCSFVERVNTPPRSAKVTSKLMVYKEYWTENGRYCTEEEWNECADGVLSDGASIDIGEGFNMCRSNMTVSIRAEKQSTRSAAAQQIFDEVAKAFETTKQSQRGLDAAALDSDGIQMMIDHMIAGTSTTAVAGAAAASGVVPADSITPPSDISAASQDAYAAQLSESAHAQQATSDLYRHALIMTDKTKFTGAQAGLQDKLLELYEADELVVATYNCKTGIVIAFTESAKSSYADELGTDLVAAVLDKARSCVTNEQDVYMGEDSSSVYLKKQQVSALYDTLKDMKYCNRVVVITGEMGGRGVAYHDSTHSRILTDMFASWPVPNTSQVLVHSEALIQILGRVNTIHTPKCRNAQGACPTIRLWAPEALHELHELCLKTVLVDTHKVQETKDYGKALHTTPLYVLGHSRKDGKAQYLRTARNSFNKHEREERQGGETEALVDVQRLKKPRIQLPFSAPGHLPDPSSPIFEEWRLLILRICLEKDQRIEYKLDSTAMAGSGRTREEWVAGQIQGPRSGGAGKWYNVALDKPQSIDGNEPRSIHALEFDAKHYGIQWKVDEGHTGKHRTVLSLQCQMQHLGDTAVTFILQSHARALCGQDSSNVNCGDIHHAIRLAMLECPTQQHAFECIDKLYGQKRGRGSGGLSDASGASGASGGASMDIDTDLPSEVLPGVEPLLTDFVESAAGDTKQFTQATARRYANDIRQLFRRGLLTTQEDLMTVQSRDMEARFDGDESNVYSTHRRSDLLAAMRAVVNSQQPATEHGYQPDGFVQNDSDDM